MKMNSNSKLRVILTMEQIQKEITQLIGVRYEHIEQTRVLLESEQQNKSIKGQS